MYSYNFKIITESKFFKRNAIYAFYPDMDSIPITYTLQLQTLLYSILLTLAIIIGSIIWNLEKIRHFMKTSFVLSHTNLIFVNSYSFSDYKKLFGSDIYSLLFYFYLCMLIVFIFAFQVIKPMSSDDWIMGSHYTTFYSPTQLFGYFWQRGRHIADVFMSLSMRPFGEILVSCGMDSIQAFYILSSFFSVIFYFLLFFAASLLVWLLNDKKDFKLIFTIVSLFIIIIFESRTDYIGLTGNAAYIATAGLSLLIFLPLLYYFLFEKELRFSRNIYTHLGIVLVLVYCASFSLETSTLPIFGLCLFITLYYYVERKLHNISKRINFSIAYLLGSFLFFILLAFSLTLKSGRGKDQFGKIEHTSLIDIFSSTFTSFYRTHDSFLYLMIYGSIALCGFIYYFLAKKRMKKKYYIQTALLCIGIIGVIGFCAIRVVGIGFEVLLIFCVLLTLLLQYKNHNNKLLAFFCSVMLIGSIFYMAFALMRLYDDTFKKYYPYREATQNIKQLFIQANAKNQEKILLTKDDIIRYKLQYSGLTNDTLFPTNSHITRWMQMYNVVDKPIIIRVID